MSLSKAARRAFRERLEAEREALLARMPYIEIDPPAGMEEGDILGGVANPIMTHFRFIWKWLDVRFTQKAERFWGDISQLPPRADQNAAHPRPGVEWHGWEGPQIGYARDGGAVYADYGSLEISEPFVEQLRNAAEVWPGLIRDHAPTNLIAGYLDDLGEYLRYFDRDSFTLETLAFIDGVPAHRPVVAEENAGA